MRIVPCGARYAALTAIPSASSRSRYSPTVRQLQSKPGGSSFQPASWRAQLLEHLVGDRRVAQPVLAEHLERHALVHLRLVRRVREQLEVGVRVHVDEPGQTNRPSASIVRAAGSPPSRPTAAIAVAGDADVGCVPRVAGAVDHAAAAEQQVEHADPNRRLRSRRPARAPSARSRRAGRRPRAAPRR